MDNNNLPDIGQKNSCAYINNAQTRGIGIIMKEYDHPLPVRDQNNKEEILDNSIFPNYSSRKINLEQENNDNPSNELVYFFTKTDSQDINIKIDNDIIKPVIIDPPIKNNQKKKFKIVNPKLGRKRKDKLNSPGKDKKKTHDKFEKGNINQKIKVRFLKFAKEYSNELYEKYQKKKCRKFIKMIEYRKPSSKEEMKNFLSLKLSKIFSVKLSGRCRKEDKNYNIVNIKKLMEKEEPRELFDFLNLSVQDAYSIYIREGEDKIPEFNYQNFVNKNEKDEIDGKGERYKDKFRNNAKLFLENIKNS